MRLRPDANFVARQAVRMREILHKRAEIETFIAIALEVMKRTNVSKLREAARVVKLRYTIREVGGTT